MTELERILRRHKAALFRQERQIQLEMAQRWRGVQDALEAQMEMLAQDIRRQGLRRVSPGRLAAMERYQALLRQVQQQVALYSQQTAPLLSQQQQQYVQLGLFDAGQALETAGVTSGFHRLPVDAVNVAIGLAGDGSPLQQLLAATWPEAVDGLTQQLIDGVALGHNPARIARAMSRATGASLDRMLTVARTETLRVYRQSTLDQYRASGVVTGHRRLAAKDRRTCAACMAADGEVLAMDEVLYDHPRGRCTSEPIIDGVASQRQLARDWFRDQPAEVQISTLGPGRYRAWQTGRFDLDALATVRDNPTWGRSLAPTPLEKLVG
jgi:SPP1 gp7 family putative phage head morphogenesis protein